MSDYYCSLIMLGWTILGTAITLKGAFKKSLRFYTEKTVERRNGEVFRSEPAIFKLRNKDYNIPNPDNPYLTEAELSIYKSLVCLAQDILSERKWIFIGLVLIVGGNVGTFLLSLKNHLFGCN